MGKTSETPSKTMLSAIPSTLLNTARTPVVMLREAAWKPGAMAPAYLDGSLPADAGCDPLYLAALAMPPGVKEASVNYSCKGSIFDRICPFPWTIEERKAIMEQRTSEEIELTLNFMRAAELKHSRLAMLAVIGWPLAEMLQSSLPFDSLAFTDGCAPVVINGLGAYTPFMLLVFGVAGVFELQSVDDVFQTYLSAPTKKYVPGDLGFDPLELEGKVPSMIDQRSNEIYNGRLAMLAITGFAVQEALWGQPVIDQPISSFF